MQPTDDASDATKQTDLADVRRDAETIATGFANKSIEDLGNDIATLARGMIRIVDVIDRKISRN